MRTEASCTPATEAPVLAWTETAVLRGRGRHRMRRSGSGFRRIRKVPSPSLSAAYGFAQPDGGLPANRRPLPPGRATPRKPEHLPTRQWSVWDATRASAPVRGRRSQFVFQRGEQRPSYAERRESRAPRGARSDTVDCLQKRGTRCRCNVSSTISCSATTSMGPGTSTATCSAWRRASVRISISRLLAVSR